MHPDLQAGMHYRLRGMATLPEFQKQPRWKLLNSESRTNLTRASSKYAMV